MIHPAPENKEETDFPAATRPGPSSTRVLPRGLLVLFGASGCAALMYEIVWFQMLQLVIGSTAVSMGVILASFMGGMCLGSIFMPRLLGSSMEPLRLWSLLELGIGVFGILVFIAMPGLAKLYAAIAPSGFIGILFRGLICGICLLPPTILMGATLPAIGPLASPHSEGTSWLGLLYAANTLGAVLGALLAGFLILRVFDTAVATGVAACINSIIGIVGLTLRVPASDSDIILRFAPQPDETLPRIWPIYLTISISGFCALGAEVVWTRLLSLMLGGTTYTFSIILAVFLLGLGIGSGAGAVLARQLRNPGIALGACQLLLVTAIGWAAFMLANSLPYWPISPSLSKSIWLNLQMDFLRCLWAVLPATCFWGASFPLALAAAEHAGLQPGLLVGRLYAANTLGAIIGALACSILLIAWLGTQGVQRLLVVLSAAAGLIALIRPSATRNAEGPGDRTAEPKPFLLRGASKWLAVGIAAAVLAWFVPSIPWALVAYGRYLPEKSQLGTVLYVAEGMNASVAVTQLESGVRNFHVSGKIEASTDQQDMRLQRMLGHIPALFHPDPRSVLVVGCGAGITAGSFLVHPSIETVSICEIEPLIPRVVARYFGEENYDVTQSPRVRLIFDDARHYILATQEKFDVITSDPIHPWVKGAASLYTKEYFELCRRHLNSGGIVTQWVPLYESDLATVKSEIATFFDVFPNGTIWSNEDLGAGYDLVLLGQIEPLEVDLETLQRRLSREDHRKVAQSLREVGIRSAFSLVATYAGQARDLKAWLKNAQLNRDRDLRLQYLAGIGLNLKQSDPIYTEMSSYRRFPEEIFVGSNLWNDTLRRTLAQPEAKKGQLGH